MISQEKALVLFSGGQDSATILAWALDRFDVVETLGFHYGQRHAIEMDCRETFLRTLSDVSDQWHTKLGPDHVLTLQTLAEISETALTREVEIDISEAGLPSTFVPGRNLIFLTYAAALAYKRGIRSIVTGVCETDYSGYPDCRDETIKSLQKTLNLGMEAEFALCTPLMWVDKAETWAMAEELGGSAYVDLILEESHTCYLGDRTRRHVWGYGCGTCPACTLRKQGFETYQARKEERL